MTASGETMSDTRFTDESSPFGSATVATPSDTPTIDHTPVQFQTLDANFVPCEMVTGLIAIAIVTLLAAVAVAGFWLFRGLSWWLGIIAAAAFALNGLLAFSSFLYPRSFFKAARWKLDSESLEIHKGVLWKHRISVPRGRVQHADVAQGPLQRRFGLGKLIVHTAGTEMSAVELDGLNHDLALQLRDQLIRQTHEHSAS